MQIFFALFGSISGAWAWYVWRERAHAHRIHILMGALCVLKALTVLAQVRIVMVCHCCAVPCCVCVCAYPCTALCVRKAPTVLTLVSIVMVCHYSLLCSALLCVCVCMCISLHRLVCPQGPHSADTVSIVMVCHLCALMMVCVIYVP
jgi:hypothetical protein